MGSGHDQSPSSLQRATIDGDVIKVGQGYRDVRQVSWQG